VGSLLRLAPRTNLVRPASPGTAELQDRAQTRQTTIGSDGEEANWTGDWHPVLGQVNTRRPPRLELLRATARASGERGQRR